MNQRLCGLVGGRSLIKANGRLQSRDAVLIDGGGGAEGGPGKINVQYSGTAGNGTRAGGLNCNLRQVQLRRGEPPRPGVTVQSECQVNTAGIDGKNGQRSVGIGLVEVNLPRQLIDSRKRKLRSIEETERGPLWLGRQPQM